MASIYGGSGKFRGRNGQRDSQRSKCYKAENATSMRNVMQWGSRADIPTCQTFIDGVLSRPWAVTLWHRAPRRSSHTATIISRSVKVTDSGGKRGASASYSTIYVSTPMRNHLILLHELAHCLTPNDVGHGREWARTYLLLVTRVMGRAAGAELRAQFVAHGVKYRKVTRAQREAGKRLAACRGDGGAGLARYRVEQAAKRAAEDAAKVAQGMVKSGRHWFYPAPTEAQLHPLRIMAAARNEKPLSDATGWADDGQ